MYLSPRLSSGSKTSLRLGLAALLALGVVSVAWAQSPLQNVMGSASAVAATETASVTSYNSGRVLVARLVVDRLVFARAAETEVRNGGNVEVVEMRDVQELPPLFKVGDTSVVLLRRAKMNSYLRKTLPPGVYLEAVPNGVLRLSSRDRALETADLVSRVLHDGTIPSRGKSNPSSAEQTKAAERQAELRKLAFDLMAAEPAILVDDGIHRLSSLPELSATLTSGEQMILSTALSRGDLPDRVRTSLIQAIAATGLKQMIPDLRRLTAASLRPAAWSALEKLGAGPSLDELRQLSASADPAVRGEALSERLRVGGADEVADVSRAAHADPDESVRVAIVETLGQSGLPQALPAVERLYDDPSWSVRQAVARALLHIGGDPAQEVLARLAVTGGSIEAQRYALVMLLVAGAPRDGTLVKGVLAAHPDDQYMKKVVEQGIEGHHH